MAHYCLNLGLMAILGVLIMVLDLTTISSVFQIGSVTSVISRLWLVFGGNLDLSMVLDIIGR